MKHPLKSVAAIILVTVIILLSIPSAFARSEFLPSPNSYDLYNTFTKAHPELTERETFVPLRYFSDFGELVVIHTVSDSYQYSLRDANGAVIILTLSPNSLTQIQDSYFLGTVPANHAAHLGTLVADDLPQSGDLIQPPANRYMVEMNGAQYWYISYQFSDLPPTLECIVFPGEASGMDHVSLHIENPNAYPLTAEHTMLARLLNPAEAEEAVSEMYARIERRHPLPKDFPLAICISVICSAAVTAVVTWLVTFLVMRKRAKNPHRFGGNEGILEKIPVLETPPEDVASEE